MGFLGALFGRDEPRAATTRREPVLAPRAASPENPSTNLSNPDSWLLDWAGGGVALFGPPVSEGTAMAVGAVYRCVSLLSGLIAGTPLRIYRDDPDQGRQVVEPDIKDDIHGDAMRRLARLLTQAPYPGRALTAYAWRELWGAGLYLGGNSYSVKRYDNAARLVAFEHAPWQSVEVYQRQGRNFYIVTWPDNRREVVNQDDMIHIAGPGFDGIKGASRIAANARNSVALARVLEEQSGRVHENAARPSGAFELPPNISPDGIRRMSAFYSDLYTGRANVGKPLYLDSGTKFHPFSISPVDLATIDQRRFTNADICRFFGVPPHLIGEAAGTSAWGSGIEQLTIGFLRYTLDPEFSRIESELNAKLLSGTPYYVGFDREHVATLDAKTAAEVVQTKIQTGRLTLNEQRRRDGLPAIAGGDTPLVNSTLVPLSRVLAPTPPPPEPKP